MAGENKVQVIFEAVVGNFRRNVISMTDSIYMMGNKSQSSLKGANTELDRSKQLINGLKTAVKTFALAYVGKKIFDFGKSAAVEFGKTQTALGEMASLGVEDLEALRQESIKFSNTWSGTTREDFISAAYDIKSGIESLTDEGVAKFTAMAALTSKATKASVGEMTTLFAQGYGIYSDLYGSDNEFAERFSAGISKSVQQFRTNGSQMSQYLSGLGATAKVAGADLSEVLAIGGKLQTTMEGSEAATKYASFINGAMKASKKLGLSFVDNNNKLLPAVGIIEQIKTKFGDTIDAVESAQLMEAFGRKEGVDFIKQLYDKTEELKNAQLEVNTAMQKGTQATEEMAQTMNRGLLERWNIFKQRVSNVMDMVGEKLAPELDVAFDKLFDALDRASTDGSLDRFADNVGDALSDVIGLVINLIDHIDDIGDTIADVTGFISRNFDEIVASIKVGTAAFISFKTTMMIYTVVDKLAKSTKLLTAEQWKLNIAMLSNPIGIVIAVILAFIAVIGVSIYKLKKLVGTWENVGKVMKVTIWKHYLIFTEVNKKIVEAIANNIFMVEEFASSIPIIGTAFEGIGNVARRVLKNLDNEIDISKKRIQELTGEVQRSVREQRGLSSLPNSVEQLDELRAEKAYRRKKDKDKPDQKNNPFIPTDIGEDGLGDVTGTFDDKISDIDQKYRPKEDLYDTRMDLAEKEGNTAKEEKAKKGLVNTIYSKIEAYGKLDKVAANEKERNMLEVAKNKALLEIKRITEGIGSGINQLVGEFNKPSDLKAMTKYQYQTATAKNVISKTMAVAPKVNMYLTLDGLDRKNADKVKKQVNTFMGFVAGNNKLFADMTNQVTRG